MASNIGAIVALVAVLFVVVIVARSIRIVPQARVGVVERLGRYSRSLDPGLHVLVPFLDRLRRLMDMRETVVPFPPAPVITRDNVTISIDTVFYYQVTDSVRAMSEVANLLAGRGAADGDHAPQRDRLAVARGDADLARQDQRRAARGPRRGDRAGWGIRVNRIELKSIDPPSGIQEAMEKQMRAERFRSAPSSSTPRAASRRRSCPPRASGSRRSCAPRRRSGDDPGRARASTRRGSSAPAATPRRCVSCSRRSTTGTRRPTSSPTSTSRCCRRSRTARRRSS